MFLVDFLHSTNWWCQLHPAVKSLYKIKHQHWSWLIIICCSHPQCHPPNAHTHSLLFISIHERKQTRKRGKEISVRRKLISLIWIIFNGPIVYSVEMTLSSKQMKEENHLFGRIELCTKKGNIRFVNILNVLSLVWREKSKYLI